MTKTAPSEDEDVRARLVGLIQHHRNETWSAPSEDIADAIMHQFNVKPNGHTLDVVKVGDIVELA